ncbi:MAG: hypothetical protein VX737_00275 [Pseudomonadota bacterium]|nr:hypothetical protein [Pseudomonadota bacterium]
MKSTFLSNLNIGAARAGSVVVAVSALCVGVGVGAGVGAVASVGVGTLSALTAIEAGAKRLGTATYNAATTDTDFTDIRTAASDTADAAASTTMSEDADVGDNKFEFSVKPGKSVEGALGLLSLRRQKEDGVLNTQEFVRGEEGGQQLKITTTVEVAENTQEVTEALRVIQDGFSEDGDVGGFIKNNEGTLKNLFDMKKLKGLSDENKKEVLRSISIGLKSVDPKLFHFSNLVDGKLFIVTRNALKIKTEYARREPGGEYQTFRTTEEYSTAHFGKSDAEKLTEDFKKRELRFEKDKEGATKRFPSTNRGLIFSFIDQGAIGRAGGEKKFNDKLSEGVEESNKKRSKRLADAKTILSKMIDLKIGNYYEILESIPSDKLAELAELAELADAETDAETSGTTNGFEEKLQEESKKELSLQERVEGDKKKKIEEALEKYGERPENREILVEKYGAYSNALDDNALYKIGEKAQADVTAQGKIIDEIFEDEEQMKDLRAVYCGTMRPEDLKKNYPSLSEYSSESIERMAEFQVFREVYEQQDSEEFSFKKNVGDFGGAASNNHLFRMAAASGLLNATYDLYSEGCKSNKDRAAMVKMIKKAMASSLMRDPDWKMPNPDKVKNLVDEMGKENPDRLNDIYEAAKNANGGDNRMKSEFTPEMTAIYNMMITYQEIDDLHDKDGYHDKVTAHNSAGGNVQGAQEHQANKSWKRSLMPSVFVAIAEQENPAFLVNREVDHLCAKMNKGLVTKGEKKIEEKIQKLQEKIEEKESEIGELEPKTTSEEQGKINEKIEKKRREIEVLEKKIKAWEKGKVKLEESIKSAREADITAVYSNQLRNNCGIDEPEKYLRIFTDKQIESLSPPGKWYAPAVAFGRICRFIGQIRERVKGVSEEERRDYYTKYLEGKFNKAVKETALTKISEFLRKGEITEANRDKLLKIKDDSDFRALAIAETQGDINKCIVKVRLKGLGLGGHADGLLTDLQNEDLAGLQDKSDLELLIGIEEKVGPEETTNRDTIVSISRPQDVEDVKSIGELDKAIGKAVEKAKEIVKERLKGLGLEKHADSLLTDLANKDLADLQDKSDVELLIGIKEKVGGETTSRDAIGSGDGIDMNIDDIVELNKAIVTARVKEMGVDKYVTADEVQSKIKDEAVVVETKVETISGERTESTESTEKIFEVKTIPIEEVPVEEIKERNLEESLGQITNAALKVMKDKIMESVIQKVSEGDTSKESLHQETSEHIDRSKESQHRETSEHLGKIETHRDAASKLSGLLEMAKEGSVKAADLKDEIKTVAERTPEAPSESSGPSGPSE